MPPRQKKTNRTHRVVCVCTAYECRDQFYADADGLYHPGVELLPETQAAHQRAEFRKSLLKFPHTPDHSTHQSTSSAQEELLSPLRNLHLVTTPSPTHRHESNQDQPAQPEASSDINQNLFGEDESPPPSTTESPSPSPAKKIAHKSDQSIPTRTCSKAVLAKASGHQIYDCGMFMFNPFYIISKSRSENPC